MDKVQRYFEAALTYSGQQRMDYMSDLRKREPELYGEVDALLLADEQSKVWEASPAADTTPVARGADLRRGDQIGPYCIVEQIAAGGMGVIYKALDGRLERLVALKFLPSGLNSDSRTRQRFLAEARAASQLDHPGICVIYDVGETPDGRLYITMPCYEGETLARRIGRGPLPHQDALDIAIQVAEGLSAAHARQIVHRDIKPSNIMLVPDGGVKVLDFGIAKVADLHLTSTGMSIGTLAYMSPEQLRGEPVDGRTDVWALGVVLFECLSGRQAFPGRALPDILQAVLGDDRLPLSSVSDDWPQPLQNLLQQALARDLPQRFADMDSMLTALHDVRAALAEPDGRHRISASPYRPTTDKDADKPRSYAWEEQVLERIATLLTSSLGPIAPVLVRRKAKTAADLNQLRDRLAASLPDQASRDSFYRQLDRQMAALTSPPAPRALNTDGSLAGVDLSPTQLAAIEASLVTHVGPIALTMIRHHAGRARSADELCASLAQQLNDPEEKRRFIEKMHGLFDSQ